MTGSAATALAEGLVVGAGAALLLGASSKLTPLPRVGRTLMALGLVHQDGSARRLAKLVGVAELVTFLGLTLARDWVSAALVMALGTAFALVGWYAVRRHLRVECNCFGVGKTLLGRPQIAAWPVWLLVGAGPISVSGYREQSMETRLTLAAAAAGIAIARHLWDLLPLWSQTTDRRLARSNT